MKPVMSKDAVDIWEAWVDLQLADGLCAGTLFVWGDVCVGRTDMEPKLVKRRVQGADPCHLYLEVMPYVVDDGHIKEVTYSEALYDVHKYQCITIFCGEEVVANIDEIEHIK